MLRYSLRMVGLCAKRTVLVPQVKNYVSLANRSMFSFCETKKNGEKDQTTKEEVKKGKQQSE